MEIHTRIVNDIAVVEVSGPFLASDAMFKARLIGLARQGYTRVLIDLAGVDYMDSNGLGELVAGYIASLRLGGTLKLMRVTRRVQVLLNVTNLTTVLDTFDDETRAVASFSEPDAVATSAP